MTTNTSLPWLGASALSATLAVAAGSLAARPSTSGDVPREAPTKLDDATKAAIVGGVSANVQWPAGHPWGQSYDNLRFDIEIDNAFGTPSASVQAYADATKVGYATVSTPGPSHNGRWHARMDWPVPGQKDLQITYVHDGKTYNAEGSSLLPDQYLLPDVKVHTVKFWNATSPSMSTNVSSSISRALVDNHNAAIPDRDTNIDGIFAENCPVSTKTQWRFAGVGTMQISDDCMDMVASGRSNASCRSEFYANYSGDPANVHVVYIKRNQINGWAGAHSKSGSTYSITIRDDWAGNGDLDALLAHELGHTYVGGHVNDTALDNCGNSRTNRNLMCSNVGRIMVGSQCTTARNSSRYQDRN